jgi:hypothetical protein
MCSRIYAWLDEYRCRHDAETALAQRGEADTSVLGRRCCAADITANLMDVGQVEMPVDPRLHAGQRLQLPLRAFGCRAGNVA